MTTSNWSHVLTVVAIASLIGCVKDRQVATNPEAASSVVAPDKTQPDTVASDLISRAVEQHYPNLAAQSNRVPVLWFVADANNQVLATRRNDVVSPSGSFDEIRRQFPNVDLSHLSDVRVVYGATDGTVVWARTGSKDANIAPPQSPMRATVANLVTHYYGTTASTGHLRTLWFKASTSGVVVAHGEGIPAGGLIGSRGYQFTYAPAEVLPDSVRAVWMSELK
jgi:hypothetical protein